MTSKRLYFILLGSIGLLFIGLIAGAYGINSLLSSRATNLTTLKAKSLALSQQQLSITKAKKDVKTYASLQKIAKSVVPQDKNQAEAVRQIVKIAADNNVSLATITFPASTLGTLPTGAPSTGAVAPAPSPAAGGSSKAGTLSQLLPVKNIPGVYNLLITVQSDSNQPVLYSKFVNFLSALEHNRRTAQVSTITLSPDSKNHNLLTFTLTLNEYIKP